MADKEIILKGLIFIKHGQVGTRSEGPEYHIQTRKADFILKYDESRNPWEPDYRLEYYNRMMVEIDGVSQGSYVLVKSIQKICYELIPDVPSELEDCLWVLESYGTPDNMIKALEKPKVTAKFKQGSVGGSDGCNAYGGDCKIVGNTMSISKIISTLMYCIPPEIMKQAMQYYTALNDAESYEIKGQKLYIHCGKTAGDLVFICSKYVTLEKYLSANKDRLSK
jgi:heat shock protein HslJ